MKVYVKQWAFLNSALWVYTMKKMGYAFKTIQLKLSKIKVQKLKAHNER